MPPKAKHNDFTGQQRAKVAAEQAAVVAERESQIALANAAEATRVETEILDYTRKPELPTVVDDVEELEVDVAQEWVIIRTNEDIDQMTLGVGNHYSFKAGQKVKVSRHVADWLEEKGLVWH